MYKELIEKKTAHSNNMVDAGAIKVFDAPYDRYCSLFSFDESIIEYVRLQKTVSEFPGVCHCDALLFDFDNKDFLAQAQADCLKLIYRLNREYNVIPADLFIYFSGNKGFHLAIHARHFGGFTPSRDLPEKIKTLAKNISTGIGSIDYGLYETVRFFRIVNSMNTKSGLYKIEISFEELQDCTIEEIKEIAKKPRPLLVKEKDINSIFSNELLFREWQNAQIQENEKTTGEREDGRDFFEPAEQGNRNNLLYKQSCAVFYNSDLSKKTVSDLMWAKNQQYNPPLDKSEFDILLESAYKSTVTAKAKKETKEDITIKPFSGWVDEYIDYTFHQSSHMTTGFESFDRVLRGKLKGKLGCIIGYGGSKKSLFALNAALQNIHSHNSVVVYSTMEMSSNQLISRILDIVVESENNFSYEIEKMKIEDAKNFLKDTVSPILGNKLHITQNAALTCRDLDKLIAKIISETGRLDMLVVDGLSMMGGDGKETERYSDNTRELKELANKWNILIYLICHVSKGAEKHSRDLIEKVRGSEKVFDNCDFIITLSQIIDITQATQDVMEYRNDKGYARMYDKRGSGKTLNKIFDFKSTRLLIEESIESPYSYEYKTKDLKTENEEGSHITNHKF